MKKIVGYFPDKPTWRKVAIEEYKKVFNHDVSIYYLDHEILESVDREMKVILTGDKAGFYAGLRFLFPEVSHLSHLYYGKEWGLKESKYVSRFMRKFNILSPECGVYYEVFRHGLMHSHHPKWIKRAKNGWYISNTEKLDKLFGIFIPGFTEQIKLAITQFINELKTEQGKKKKYRLDKFFDAMVDVGKILNKKDLKGYAKYDYPKVKL